MPTETFIPDAVHYASALKALTGLSSQDRAHLPRSVAILEAVKVAHRSGGPTDFSRIRFIQALGATLHQNEAPWD